MMGVARVEPDQAEITWRNWWAKYITPIRKILRWAGLAGVAAAMFFAGTLYQQREDYAELDRAQKIIQDNSISYSTQVQDVANQRNILQNELAAIKKTQAVVSMTASPMLGLTDVTRWRLANKLRTLTLSYVGPQGRCDAFVYIKPDSPTATQAWSELNPVAESGNLYSSGYSGGARTVYPDGITVETGLNDGPAYFCAYRFYEMLVDLKIKPVRININTTAPGLTACQNKCFEFVIGDLKVEK